MKILYHKFAIDGDDNIEKLIMINGPNVFKIIEKYIDRSILKDNRIFFAYKASWKEIDRLWKKIIIKKKN